MSSPDWLEQCGDIAYKMGQDAGRKRNNTLDAILTNRNPTMKITFKPLHDPAPVRPADMPEGVEFEHKNERGSVFLCINRGGVMHYVDEHGNANEPDADTRSDYAKYCTVLKRRDGHPLPGVPDIAPMPLDQLDPFPVWYRRGTGYTWWYQHDGVGGYTVYTEHTKEVEMHAKNAGSITVSPTPYLMEVQP